jgi:tetratricopeptide (TPR) repeat protein
MKTRALFLFTGFLLTPLFPLAADARLFSARLMASDKETLLPQAQPIDSAGSTASADKDDALSLESAARLSQLADLYRRRGLYCYAAVILEEVVEKRQRTLGTDNPEIADYLDNLADVYRAKQDYAKAEPLYLRSLAIKEQSLGLHHPDVAASLSNLADLYREQSRYQEAQPLYQRALAILEQVFGADHPDVAAVRASYMSVLAAMKLATRDSKK